MLTLAFSITLCKLRYVYSPVNLKLEEEPIHLVDGQYGFDALPESLAKDSLGPHAPLQCNLPQWVPRRWCAERPWPRRRCRRARENWRGWSSTCSYLAVLEIFWRLLRHFVVQRNAGGFDGDSSFCFVFPSVGHSHIPGNVLGDDPGCNINSIM